MPGSVQHANEKVYDSNIKRTREFDIITKKCIIEIKSKSVARCLRQFLLQKNYADNNKKHHVVFAPDILFNTKSAYEKCGVKIVKTTTELINFIKENEK